MDADKPLEDETIIASGQRFAPEPGGETPLGDETPLADETHLADETRLVADPAPPTPSPQPAVPPPPAPVPVPDPPELAPDLAPGAERSRGRGTILEQHLGPPPPPAPVRRASREQLPSLHRRERLRRLLTLIGFGLSVVISGTGLWVLWLLW